MRLLAAIVSLSLLTSCAPYFGHGPITKEAADKIIPASTHNERAIRVCLAVAIVSEVWVFRLRRFGGTEEERTYARAAIQDMVTSLTAVKMEADDPQSAWYETAMYYAATTIMVGVGESVKDRVIDGIDDALIGNILGILSKTKVVAGQTALTLIMLRDANLIMTLNDLNDLVVFQWGWETCQKRINRSQGLLE